MGARPWDTLSYHIPHHPEAAEFKEHGLLKVHPRHQVREDTLWRGGAIFQDVVCIFNQCLIYGAVSPVGRIHGLGNRGQKWEWPHLHARWCTWRVCTSSLTRLGSMIGHPGFQKGSVGREHSKNFTKIKAKPVTNNSGIFITVNMKVITMRRQNH